MDDPLQKETNWDVFYRERRKRGVMDKPKVKRLVDGQVVWDQDNDVGWWKQRAEAAEARAAELQAEVERLREALNKIYISGTPDDEAWQIAMNALRSKDV